MAVHKAGVSAKSKKIIETVTPEYLIEGIYKARQKTIDVLNDICSELKEGMSEKEARDVAMKIFRDHGCREHWHKPYIRFGPGTSLTFNQLLQHKHRLQENDPYYLDLGPVWESDGIEYEGDYGDSFVFGKNKDYEALIKKAHTIHAKTKDLWKKKKLTGIQMYKAMKKMAEDAGVKLVADVDGHRLSDFPHFKYSKKRLSEIRFHPSENLWILELQINDLSDRFGVFYEDLLA